jgi:hypothetical protein
MKQFDPNWTGNDASDGVGWIDEYGYWRGEIRQMRNCGRPVERDFRAVTHFKPKKGSLRVRLERKARSADGARKAVDALAAAIERALPAFGIQAGEDPEE